MESNKEIVNNTQENTHKIDKNSVHLHSEIDEKNKENSRLRSNTNPPPSGISSLPTTSEQNEEKTSPNNNKLDLLTSVSANTIR